ncbi:MAG: Hsp20/alpha crystallin family protein [Chloroflexi bacterium]|nr:Hsp20/alpha crystallin family protein [Chloroflexota bacterium]
MAIQRYRPRPALAPWRPFEEMERLMESAFRGWPTLWERAPGDGMAWAPSIDVFDKKDSIVVRAELPGMKKEEIDVKVEGNTMIIGGERKASTEVKEEDYYRSEMVYGKFTRSITLPSTVDAARIEATYKDGILEVNLPKTEAAKPKKIEIKVK